MIGYATYTDRFAGTLKGINDHLDHLSEMGVRYLHLMPLLQPRQGANDGGYAVADHHTIRTDLGTMDDLDDLTATLRSHGISLVVDLVVNHVAAEHEWAQRARAGQQKYRDYFHVLKTQNEVDAWEKDLPEVFPDFARGNFTWNDDCQGWVWTTFNEFQWDLNWANPDVFCEFLDLMCELEVFRLDAIAFIWKKLGTGCQNLPQVHDITQSLRQAMRIVAPAVAFKAEAVVGPNDLIGYLGRGRHWGKVSDMAYHNSLMVQLWSALAARDVSLMETALSRVPDKPSTTTWATYARCHDDIGWAIDDADAHDTGLDPETGDRRISGSLASLAGLERALEAEDPALIDATIARIVMMHTAILGYGGVPLIWMGDEVGMLNDDWQRDPDHADDNRWVHRPVMDWSLVEQAQAEPHSVPGRIWRGVRHQCSSSQPRVPRVGGNGRAALTQPQGHHVGTTASRRPDDRAVQRQRAGSLVPHGNPAIGARRRRHRAAERIRLRSHPHEPAAGPVRVSLVERPTWVLM